LHHEHRLEMILIVHAKLGTGLDFGDVERKAHLVLLEQEPGAFPSVRFHVAVGVAEFLESANDHDDLLVRRRCRSLFGGDAAPYSAAMPQWAESASATQVST